MSLLLPILVIVVIIWLEITPEHVKMEDGLDKHLAAYLIQQVYKNLKHLASETKQSIYMIWKPCQLLH